jgi:hypothetical protein
VGSGEALAGLLWRARSGVRVDRLPLFAGHGMADQHYRPPRLPYASVIGPLNLELESEREPVRSVYLWAQIPGYLGGVQRADADLVPAPGPLTLRLDGDAQATLQLDFGTLAGQPLTAGEVGPQAAALVEAALREAVDAGGFQAGGVPVTDEARRAELRAATVRWDRARRRVVVASGRRGVVSGPDPAGRPPTRVEVLGPAGGVASALGLGAGALAAGGRVVRHRRSNPSAVAVDVRLDLWAGSQSELAAALDAWARITPTRGQLLERPALLAADVEHGATTVRLQSTGESATRWTLLQLEAGGGELRDRLSGRGPELVNGATVEAGGVHLSGQATATLRFFQAPAVPVPWQPDHPGAGGYAASLRLTMGQGAAGDVVRVLAVERGGRTALRLDVEFVQENGDLRARLLGAAQHVTAGDFAGAAASVDPAELARGAEVHLLVDASAGAVSLFLNGAPVGAAPAAPQPGTPVGGADMRLVLGGPDGSPVPFQVAHVQLHGGPLGPVDPKLRPSAAPASAWSLGEPVALARSEDGVTIAGEAFSAGVVAVDGDELTLDRPVQGSFRRATTLAFKRSLFFSQRQLRRSDDLMNQLYRITVEYRVSTFLDERYPSVSAPLAEIAELEVRELARLAAEAADPEQPAYPARPAAGHPGTHTLITPSTPDGSHLSEATHG